MATKVYIVYYSMYGHFKKLAHEIKKGVAPVEGVEAKLWQVPEEILAKMSGPLKGDAPVIAPDDLVEDDGFIFDFPTRFGMMPAQFKITSSPSDLCFGERPGPRHNPDRVIVERGRKGWEQRNLGNSFFLKCASYQEKSNNQLCVDDRA